MKGQVYDLTQIFAPDMLTTKSLGPFQRKILLDLDHNDFQLSQVSFATHIGTHFDAPRHYYREKDSISDIPAERLFGRAVVVDVQRGRHGLIEVADVEKSGFEVRPGDFVFFNTGWDAKYAAKDPTFYEVSSLSEELAQWLVERKVGIVGMDTCSVDLAHDLRGLDFQPRIHRKLLSNDVYIMECLRLTQVAGKELQVYALPMLIAESDGAPVRVIGIEQ